MATYYKLQQNVTDENGDLIPASVTVARATDDAAATIWSDEGSTVITQPLTATGGLIEFYSRAGAYNVTVDDGSGTQTFRVDFGGDGTAYNFDSRADAISALAAIPTGATFRVDDLLFEKVASSSAISDMSNVEPRGDIYVDHFGALPDNSTDSTTAIQAAVDYMTSIAPPVLNKAGGGGVLNFKRGVYHISDKIDVEGDGVILAGQGPHVTVIRQLDETKDCFEFAGTDPFNTGNADALAARPENQGIRDMGIYVDQNDHTNALSAKLVVFRRSLGFIKNMYLRGYHTGIVLSGVAEGFKVNDVYMTSQRGSGVTSQKTNDAHISIELEQVDPSDALAQSGGDGNSYDRPVGVYLDNVQTKDPQGTYGVYDALKVDAIDGLYVTNSHFGFAARANFIIAPSTTIGCLNVMLDNVFLDGSDAISGGPTDYSFAIIDSGPTAANIQNILATNLRMNIGSDAGVMIDAENARGVVISDFTMNRGVAVPSGADGFRVKKGSRLTFANGQIDSCNGGFYFLIDDDASIEKISITGIIASDLSAAGDAIDGIRVNGDTPDLVIANSTILDVSAKGIEVKSLAADPKRFKVSNVVCDTSQTVASANTISIPLEHDTVYITGTTDIENIKDFSEGNSEFEGRNVTLVFADSLTVLSSGNMGLQSSYKTSAGTTLELVFIDGSWRAMRGDFVERGQNSDGRYVRFADGTQICYIENLASGPILTTSGNLFSSSSVTWTFPAAFSESPTCSGEGGDTSAWPVFSNHGSLNVAVRCMATLTNGSGFDMHLTAIGRWF